MLFYPRDKKFKNFHSHVIKGDIRDQPPSTVPAAHVIDEIRGGKLW